MKNKTDNNNKDQGNSALALGLCFGLLFGLLTDNLALGLCIGVALGFGFRGKKRE